MKQCADWRYKTFLSRRGLHLSVCVESELDSAIPLFLKLALFGRRIFFELIYVIGELDIPSSNWRNNTFLSGLYLLFNDGFVVQQEYPVGVDWQTGSWQILSTSTHPRKQNSQF